MCTKTFSVRKVALAVMVALAGVAGVSAAVTETVADGGSYTLDPSDSFNAGGNTIKFSGSGTLVVSAPAAGTKLLVVAPNVIADQPGAVLTIDLTAVPNTCDTLFNGHLVNDLTGSTVVTGGNGRLLCGQAVKSSVTASHTSVVKLANVTGVDGITLTNQFTLVSAPAALDLRIADGANAAFAARGVLDRFVTDGAGGKTFTPYFNVVLMSPDALSDPDVKIVVSAGLLLSVYQAQVTSAYRWSSTEGGVFSNAVELASATSQLSFTGMYRLEAVGAITGNGTIVRDGSNIAGNGIVHLNGVLGGFTGEFKNTGASGKFKVTGDFAPSAIKLSAYDAAATNVTIFAGGGVQRIPAGGIEYTGVAGRRCMVMVEDGVEVFAAGGGFLPDNVILKGAERTTSRITVEAMAAGDVVGDRQGANISVAPTAAIQALPEVFTFVNDDGCKMYYRSSSAAVCDLSGTELVAGRYSLAAKSGVVYRGLPADITLSVTNGVSATLRPEPGAVTNSMSVAAGGALMLTAPQQAGELWRNKLLARFDPSVAESVVYSSTAATYDGMSGFRAGEISNCLNGVTGDYRLLYNSSTVSTWPGVVAGAEGKICPSGLSFITCDLDNSRYTFKKGSAIGINAPFAVMVFGSHPKATGVAYGNGGEAIFASANGSGAYARGGTAATWDTTKSKPALPAVTAPIFATNGIPLWVDGVATDGTTTGFNGGWQVLSVGTSYCSLYGIGFRSAANNGSKFTAGGQNYGEILLFAEVPTELERQAAERYLAAKWGVTYQGPDAPQVKAVVRVDGEGALTLGDDVTVAGGFRGTLNLAGHAVEFAAEPVPPGEEVVPSEGRLAWFDPDDDDTLNLSTSSVNAMYQHHGSKATGEKFLNSASRPPKLIRGAHGAGAERNWIYYSPYQVYGATGKAGNGLSMRMNEVGQAEAATTAKPITCKTLIMVQDSSAGGGTPFQDNRSSGGQFGYRIPNRVPDAENQPALASVPIWADPNSAATMKNGSTYLNNVEVDGESTGFTGGPETLAVTRENGFNVGYFANLYYQNDMTDFVEYGEIQGEILMFDSVLAADTRSAIEAYLAWKWFGAVREGYTQVGGATIAGASGRVKVGSAANAPAFAPDFAGTVVYTENSLAFAVDGATGQVANRIALGAGAAEFPAAVTVNVDVSGKLPGGTYNLISAPGGGLSDTAWTLVGVRKAGLRVTDTAVDLVRMPGFSINIR